MSFRKKIKENTSKLACEISKTVGLSKIIDDEENLSSYSIDKSHCKPSLPDLVVKVENQDEIVQVLKQALLYRVPVVARGGGTGKSGGAVAFSGGVVLDMTSMNKLLEIDRENLIAVVQPGLITGELQAEVEKEGLFYPPDPNSLDTCTIGGNVAHNAGGPRAFKYGVTREYLLGMDLALMGGETLFTGKRTIKGVAGYDLTALMCGSEGTLGVFLRHVIKLIRKPSFLSTLLVMLPDEQTAGKVVAKIIASGQRPSVLELMDNVVVEILKEKNIGQIDEKTGAILLIEQDGYDEDFVKREISIIGELVLKGGANKVMMALDEKERTQLWTARRLMSDALAETSKYKASEDVVVLRSVASEFLRDLKALSKKYEVKIAAYGHAGDGNYHVNVLWDDDKFKPDKIIGEIFKLAVSLGGTITGEHGLGLTKKDYLHLEQGTSIIALQKKIKRTFDPEGLLNPGKMFD